MMKRLLWPQAIRRRSERHDKEMTGTSENKRSRRRDDPATVATRVAELLRDDIIQGIICGGERLSEVALAKRYGISRIPIREALRIVEGQGLVEIHPFTGAFVSELSVDDVVDIFEIHEALESIALRLALPQLTSDDLRSAEQLARKSEREPDPRRRAELVGDLYTTIYGGIGRRHLLDLLRRVTTNHSRYLYAFFSALRTDQPDLPGPRDYVVVLRKRDIDAALKFLKKWRKAQRDYFVQHMTCGSKNSSPASNPQTHRKTSGKDI